MFPFPAKKQEPTDLLESIQILGPLNDNQRAQLDRIISDEKYRLEKENRRLKRVWTLIEWTPFVIPPTAWMVFHSWAFWAIGGYDPVLAVFVTFLMAFTGILTTLTSIGMGVAISEQKGKVD